MACFFKTKKHKTFDTFALVANYVLTPPPSFLLNQYRTLVHQMGERLGVGAIAFDIFRTRVGEYAIDDALDVFSAESK